MAERRLPVEILACALVACSQILGIDGLGYHGEDDGSALDGPNTGDGAMATDGSLADGPCGSPNDSRNCGTCGHDCLGGACMGGVCQPATMFMSTETLDDLLATDDASVFFRTPTRVLGCSVTQSTCSGQLIRNMAAPSPRYLTAALKHVYWNEGSQIYGCLTASCSPTPYLLAGTPLEGIGSAVNSSYLFAVDQDNTQMVPPMRVWQMGLDDTNPNPTQIINFTGAGPMPATQVAATPFSARSFWSQPSPATLYTCASGACALPNQPDGVESVGATPRVLVATPLALYFSSFSGVWVTQLTLIGAPQPFAGNTTVTAIAANPKSTLLFYAESTTIKECPTSISKCTAPALLQTRTSPVTALTADETAIYWVEGGNTVMRLVL